MEPSLRTAGAEALRALVALAHLSAAAPPTHLAPTSMQVRCTQWILFDANRTMRVTCRLNERSTRRWL